jgi:hypothetical protein
MKERVIQVLPSVCFLQVNTVIFNNWMSPSRYENAEKFSVLKAFILSLGSDDDLQIQARN